MPPGQLSRHGLATAQPDQQGRYYLSRPPRLIYQAWPDNRLHTCLEGDTLWGLAHRYFAGVPRPAGLWWVLAEFQPVPIHDPTLALAPGRLLHVPATMRVLDWLGD